MQLPLHSWKPPTHDSSAQVPVAQLAVAWGTLQGRLQPPQLSRVLMDVSQPSVSSGPTVQLVNPATQADAGITQWPPEHWTAAPGFRFGSAVQSCAQLPQCLGSVAVSAQLEPHKSGVGATQLDAQPSRFDSVEQTPSGARQRLLQVPQLVVLVRLVSQPSLGLAVQ